MRIAVNLAAVKTIGTKVYSKGLIPPLARLAAHDELLIFMSPEVRELLGPNLGANVRTHLTPVTANVGARVAWEQTLLPLYLKQWRADVLFAAMEFSPLVCPCPVLLAVHNPSPHLDNRLESRLRRRLTYFSGRVAQKVIFVSHDSANFLGPRLRVPPAKRVVVHHGTNPERWKKHPNLESVLSEHALGEGKYLLFVSNLYRYKKPETLIEAFALWREQSGQGDFRLAFTGTSDPDFQIELDEMVPRLGLGDAVKFLGHIPMDHIPALYQGAAAFVLPTSVETFGQSFVEAMYCGAPIVCADIPVAREVCGEAALYFPVGDARTLASTLMSLLGDPSLRADLIERGLRRAQNFSFEREAGDILSLLHKLG